VRNGIDRLLKAWPLILVIVAAIVAATEIRLVAAENAKDIDRLNRQAEELQGVLKNQAEVNGRIDERTLNIQAQLNLVIQQLREAARRADESGR
jgi:hypothetical protein